MINLKDLMMQAILRRQAQGGMPQNQPVMNANPGLVQTPQMPNRGMVGNMGGAMAPSSDLVQSLIQRRQQMLGGGGPNTGAKVMAQRPMPRMVS